MKVCVCRGLKNSDPLTMQFFNRNQILVYGECKKRKNKYGDIEYGNYWRNRRLLQKGVFRKVINIGTSQIKINKEIDPNREDSKHELSPPILWIKNAEIICFIKDKIENENDN